MQIDKAAAEKHRLEEKQRASRKERQQTKQEWKPRCVSVFICKCTVVIHINPRVFIFLVVHTWYLNDPNVYLGPGAYLLMYLFIST